MLGQGEAGGVGGGKPRRVGVGIRREQRQQERALHPCGEAHLTAEPGAELRIVGLNGMDHLYGDSFPAVPHCGVHGSHTARAESAHNAIGADTEGITRARRLDPPTGTSSAHRLSDRPETVALAWTLHHPGVWPSIGPRTTEQVDRSLEARRLTLTGAQVRWIQHGR